MLLEDRLRIREEFISRLTQSALTEAGESTTTRWSFAERPSLIFSTIDSPPRISQLSYQTPTPIRARSAARRATKGLSELVCDMNTLGNVPVIASLRLGLRSSG